MGCLGVIGRLIVFLLFAAVIFLLIMAAMPKGSFGLRPTDQGCYGFIIEEDIVYQKFQKGRLRLDLVNLEYLVPEKGEMETPNNFCLGKNIWDGMTKEEREAESVQSITN